jgi:hypothetical protein
MEKSENPVILNVIHNRQNPLESTRNEHVPYLVLSQPVCLVLSACVCVLPLWYFFPVIATLIFVVHDIV